MAWPYHFVELTDVQKHERRVLLDRYGAYAQLSALVPILAFQLYRLASWVYSERQRAKIAYSAIPGSPRAKEARNSTMGAFLQQWRSAMWWLGGDVAEGWGTRGRWIAGASWTVWLLFLSIHKTGDDYLHVTKRFGQVALSQFPLHYMLALKSRYSPLALVFQSSHEELNPWHRTLGRIIYGMILLHATWYLNFFFQSGILRSRLTVPIIIIGLVALSMMTVLATSSMEVVRRWNYRVFFVLHLVIGSTLLPLLWFHAAALRWYVTEALLVFILDIVFRKMDTITDYVKISKIPQTKLLKLKVPVPSSKIGRFQAAPGQHVYLSIPSESAPSASSVALHSMLFNPFTVADVSETSITLVLRALHGPISQTLVHLTELSKARPPINIEGPYGTSKKFPSLLTDYDRVLLVAGGVGATFVIPIYNSLREQMEAESVSPDRLKLVWSMRSSAEASWVMDLDERSSISKDEHAQIFATKNTSYDRQTEEVQPADGSVELDDLRSPRQQTLPINGGYGRPDLATIVDTVFMQGSEEKVAVLVCGPVEMARELRGHVGRWVEKGRNVWWHNEAFGW
ncbi:hypothetical protein BP5796_07228 [Coleophoma crateriformis]|uniref:FAD-binding FR-type domain-containing protein n=1 Tax=Coleophoma crateriformis TaxID=565419 RepID=A0A3D8RIK6_9HELO|nr:hypothetical protein BP5796_07228 [Coleophoma crateriformis]